MLTKEEEFEAWKKKTGYKPQVEEEPVNEGFLDDNDEETPAVDSITAAETPEDEPDEEAQELIGDENEPANTDGGEEPENAPAEEDDGVSQSSADTIGELKDIIANLNTTVQSLADTIAKQSEKPEDEEGEEESGDDEFADLDLGGEGEEAEEGDEPEDGEETGDGEETEEGSDEEGDDSAEEGSGESDEGEEEYEGDDESNEEKSEAYNRNMKHGKLLNSNSGSIIGPLEAGKYWKIDEGVITLAKLKLRQRIEECKREIRTKILLDSEGEE